MNFSIERSGANIKIYRGEMHKNAISKTRVDISNTSSACVLSIYSDLRSNQYEFQPQMYKHDFHNLDILHLVRRKFSNLVWKVSVLFVRGLSLKMPLAPDRVVNDLATNP